MIKLRFWLIRKIAGRHTVILNAYISPDGVTRANLFTKFLMANSTIERITVVP